MRSAPAPSVQRGPAASALRQDAEARGVGARITIDAMAVGRNYRTLAALSSGECGAVVKADGYGLGVGSIVPQLARSGCASYFVALLSEGLALRALLPEATIFVLNGVFDDPRTAIAARLIPFVSSRDALAQWPAQAPFALNVDTGMNRLGVGIGEALELAGEGLRPALLASHFACADTPDHPLNAAQEAAFATVRAAFADVPASLANSAALLTRAQSHYDLTRPGIALYGGAAAGPASALEPVVRLEARVIQLRRVAAGESVGYGAAETLARQSRLAIASLGYADGYLRAAGGSDAGAGAPVAVGGVPTRLIGRASMDLVAIDVTDARCERGDWVELFGTTVSLDTAAAAAGTIGYELLTGLSRRAERRYAPL